jgi:hypothetical protein
VKISTFLGIVLVMVLASCSSHYYTRNGNQLTLYLKNKEAQSVLFYHSLDGYAGHQLTQQNGIWETTVSAHQAFSYFYRVNNEIFVPSCPMKEKDDFGSENCIFEPKL